MDKALIPPSFSKEEWGQLTRKERVEILIKSIMDGEINPKNKNSVLAGLNALAFKL